MASEASVAEQTTDEIGENKVIDHAKMVEEARDSQPKETGEGEIEKHAVEEPDSSGTSATDSSEIIEDKKNEASAAGVKEDVDDEASAAGVLEDKKNDSAAADEAKKENVDSEVSGSNKGDVSVVEDVKEEAETGKISNPCDVEAEASVREQEGKSLTTAESLSEAVDKTPVDSSLTSVQELDQVGYEPDVSEPVIKTVKATEESLDNSTNPALSSENIDKSEEQLIAPNVTEPAPDATEIPERESERVGYEKGFSEPAVEIAKTSGESSGISTNPALASETVEKSEEQPIALTVTEPKATGEPERESEQVGHEPEASDPVVERVKTTGESLDACADRALASETAATSEEHPKDITITEPAPETTGEPERKPEQFGQEPEVSYPAFESVKTTGENLDTPANPALLLETAATSEEHPKAITVTEPTPETTGEPERESEQVGHEPEASDPVVERVKTTGESLDACADRALASETAATSEEHPKDITITEPAPETTGEPERKPEQFGQEPEVSYPAFESVKTTGENLDTPANPALLLETAATSEEHPKAITVTEPTPETTEEPERESEQVGHEPEVSDPAVKTVKATGESLEASADPALTSETAATSEEHPKAITVTEPAPETIGEPERESEQVGHEPEVSDPSVETVETAGESFNSSVDPALASETAATSEEHPTATIVTEPTPETTEEPERESDQVGHEPEVSYPEVERVKTTGESLDVSADPTPASETVARSEEQPIALTVTGPTPDVIGELEQALEQDEPGVSEPAVEIAKTSGESLDASADPAPALETAATSEEHPKAVTVTDLSPNAIGELERKNETPEDNEVVEESKDENILAVEVQAASGLLKEESVVETGSSTFQALNKVPDDSSEVKGAEDVEGSHSFSKSMEKGSNDVDAGGYPVETKNGESEHSATESLEKEVIVDPSLPSPSIAIGKTEAMDSISTTEAAEVVIPGTNAEKRNEEKTLVKEQKEETEEAEPTEEKGEDKAVETGSTLPATNETGDQDELEVTEASSKEEKPSEGADKFIVEPDSGIADSITKTTDNIEKDRASKVADKFAEEPKNDNLNIKDDTTQAQTSGDRDLGGQTDKTNTSNKEPVVILEEAEKSDIVNVEKDETPVVNLEAEKSDVGNVERDETEEKKNETEKSDVQNLVESSRDSAVSKTDLEVQKAEASGKPSKTLMSKVKHSIGKVKKAIIGKSPGSKTISVESKDELKAYEYTEEEVFIYEDHPSASTIARVFMLPFENG